MQDALTIGLLTIRWYSLILTFSVLLVFLLIKRQISDTGFKKHFDNLFLAVVIFGIIGARLYHVIDYWEYYQNRIPQIVMIWQGGLGIFGALGAGFLVCWWYCRVKKLSLIALMDQVTPPLLLGQALGRVGNYFNQEGYGPPTSLPWGLYVEKAGAKVHPTFFYEAIWDLVGFMILCKIAPLKKGLVTAFYLIIYGSGRLLAESFRIDTAVVGGLKIGSLISLSLIVIGLYLVVRSTKLGKHFKEGT